jgi:hypothetical protein
MFKGEYRLRSPARLAVEKRKLLATKHAWERQTCFCEITRLDSWGFGERCLAPFPFLMTEHRAVNYSQPVGEEVPAGTAQRSSTGSLTSNTPSRHGEGLPPGLSRQSMVLWLEATLESAVSVLRGWQCLPSHLGVALLTDPAEESGQFGYGTCKSGLRTVDGQRTFRREWSRCWFSQEVCHVAGSCR